MILFGVKGMLTFLMRLWRGYKRDDVSVWLEKYDSMLFLICILTGGSFTALELVNSKVFHYRIFFMGLKLATWDNVWSARFLVIGVFENIPQVLFCCCFFL